MRFDVLIVGGGPAGLSAALILGRCRREVIVCNAAHYRNSASYAMYGYLSRDGISPYDFLNISRQQLKFYPNIKIKDIEVETIHQSPDGFDVKLVSGEIFKAKYVILATGISDQIPTLPGIMDFFGKSVFLCPYCDGWEFKDKPIAAYGRGDKGPCFALLLRQWTSQLTLCTDGPIGGTAQEQQRLKELNISVVEEHIVHLSGKDGQLQRVHFENRESLEVNALFFNTPIVPKNRLARGLGCEINERGEVKVNSCGLSNVPKVYAAGDASPDIKLAIVAAAEGAKAALAVDKELLIEERLVYQKPS